MDNGGFSGGIVSSVSVRLLGLSCLLCLLGSLGCESGERVEESAASSAKESFTEHRLDNGIRLIVGERRGSGLVASSVLVRAGAVWETPDLNGAAHFLEHLLFNGTTTRTQEELYADVDRLGAYNNASTRKDYAIFMFLVGAESLDEGLGIHADMLFNSTLPPGKFEKERRIVLEEIAKDHSDPDYFRGLAVDEVLYAGSSYAMPVLGTDTSIRGLDRDAVLEYYHRYYTPANTTVLLLGDMDSDAMIAAAERTYGAATGSTADAQMMPATPPAVSGARCVHVPVGGNTRSVRLRMNAPMPGDEDSAAFELLSSILAGGRGARLQRAMEMEPALTVNELYAGVSLVGGRAFFDVSAVVPEDTDVDQVASRVAGELARLTGERVSEAEVASARVGFRAEEASLREKIHYYGMMRSESILHAPTRALNEQLARHRRVTPDSIREAAERWLSSPDVVVVAAGPGLEARDEQVTTDEIGFVVPAGELPGGRLEDVVDARRAPPRADDAMSPHVVTLTNGLRVIVSTDPASNVLAMHLMALGRSFREPPDQAGIADFLHRLLLHGAGEWDAAAFGALLAAIGASVKTHDNPTIPYDDYYTSPEFSYVRFEALDDYYEEAFELLGAMVTTPRLAESEVERVREEMLRVVADADQSAMATAGLTYRKLLYGEDGAAARPISGTAETIGRITREDLVAFHARYFSPGNLVLAVVTGLPEAVVVRELETRMRFAETPAGSATPEAWTPAMARPLVTAAPERVTEDVGGPQSGVRVGYAFDFKPEDEPALEVATLLLSDRMAFQLRERLGLAYSIGSSFSSWGSRGVLTAAMGTRPENVEIAVAGLAEQIDSLAVVRLDVPVLETAVNARVGRMRMRRITRMGQAFYLCMDVLRGEPLMSHDTRLVEMRKVGPDELAQVAATYFDSDRAHQVVVR